MEDKAYFCSKCGSPYVDVSPLVGGKAKCNACGWEGSVSDLAVSPVTHDFVSQEQMVKELFNDVRKVFAENAIPFGKMLVKWGFLDPKHPQFKMHLGSYLTYGAQAYLASMIKTRELIEKPNIDEAQQHLPVDQEKIDGPAGKPS